MLPGRSASGALLALYTLLQEVYSTLKELEKLGFQLSDGQDGPHRVGQLPPAIHRFAPPAPRSNIDYAQVGGLDSIGRDRPASYNMYADLGDSSNQRRIGSGRQ